MRRFLITGGAGFIGSHLHDALRGVGASVRILDDFSTGKRSNLPADAEIMAGDVADPQTMHAALDGMDGCFHLAAIASVERSTNEWLATHRTNLTGTITVFETIWRLGTRIPVIYASSAAVYGDVKTLPISELAPKHPLSAYGADKFGCELHAAIASQIHGIPTVGLRFFNVYGPRQDPRSPYSGVISIFCQRVLAGQSVTIHGDGEQTRDFIYVGDVVAVLMAAMRLLPKAAVFNVCTGQATSIGTLANTIMRLAGQQTSIEYSEARRGDIRHSIGSPGNMQSALGPIEPTSIDDGLQQVLTWLRAT